MPTNLQKLQYIAKLVAECKKCPLHKTATNPVPGTGNPESEIVFIGEAPGYYEDQQGHPFVGNSGKLLDKLLVSIGINRPDVFICNILKHRPPSNRDPEPTEIAVCTPFLKAQLEIIKPKLIVTLGRFAMNYFFPSLSISRVHGTILPVDWYDLHLIVIPVYHPSAALRNGSMHSALQTDFQKIGQYLKNQNTITPSDIAPTPDPKKPNPLTLF